MYGLANQGNMLGQFQPFLTPTLRMIQPGGGGIKAAETPAAPEAPLKASGDAAAKVALAGGSILIAGLSATSTLFTYGLARDSQSKMVRVTGYILAGIGAITTVAYLIGGPMLAALSGDRK